MKSFQSRSSAHLTILLTSRRFRRATQSDFSQNRQKNSGFHKVRRCLIFKDRCTPQGRPRLRCFAIISNDFTFVKHFFSGFFGIFFAGLPGVSRFPLAPDRAHRSISARRPSTACIEYHLFLRPSTPFFAFFIPFLLPFLVF